MQDRIVTHRGEVRESFGGILYNLLALTAITRGNDEIVPVCSLAAEHLVRIEREHLQGHPAIRTSQIRKNPLGTDRNSLRYTTANNRDEVMHLVSPTLSRADLDGVLDCDALLLNFISGRELSLDALRELRKDFKGLIHLDIHNLGKQLSAEGKLEAAPFDDWPEWVANVDIVQANEWEAQLCHGTKPGSDAEYIEAACRFLAIPGPRIAALTVGGEGAIVVHRRESGNLYAVRVPALLRDPVVDTTGCGDCFSAGFLVGYLRWRDPARAALLATALSGLKTGMSGLDGLSRLSQAEGVAREHYPQLYAEILSGWRGVPLRADGTPGTETPV